MPAMRLFVLAFAGGVWLLQQQAVLLAAPWLAALGAGALLTLVLRHWAQELCEAVSTRTALAIRRFVAAALLVSPINASSPPMFLLRAPPERLKPRRRRTR